MLTPGVHVDRYELVCPLGEGGMAQVWIARQQGKHGFEKLFALKSIHPRLADDPAFRTMFLDEARIAAAIEHPNVAQVFDLGEEGSVLYLVMEYVDGESLSALIASAAKREGKSTATVPVGIALRIIADACAGLQAAHRLTDRDGRLRGVVHRDVSPHNILLSVRGEVKVIDFGIAHASGRVSADTAAGSLKGKLHYMAPEQALRRPLGPYTDVFGAGATLYKMLAGRPAFDGGDDASTLALIMSGTSAAPLPATVPPLVAAIVERALSPDPGDRYASAREMATALEAAIAEQGYVADVATWVKANLSERARARRAELAAASKDAGPLPPAPELAAPPAPRVASAAAATTPADDLESTKTPGFMDVRALVARGPAPVPDLPAPSNGGSKRVTDSDDDDAPVQAKPFRPAVVGDARVPRKRRVSGRALALGAAAVGAAALAAAIVGPGIVKDRIIREARDAGVELDVGSAAIGLSGITLHDVHARIPSIPEVTAVQCDDIEILGLSAREIRIRNLDTTISGPLSDVASKLLDFATRNRRRLAGTPSDPHKLTLVSGRMTWKDAFGAGTQVHAGQLGLDLDSRGAGLEDIRASIARVDVTTPQTILGPWGFAYERNAQAARARVLFDPPLMDGPSALVVWGQTGATQLTVRIPRSPFANLGVRPVDLSLPADTSTEVEGKLDAEESASGKVEGKGRLDLWGARVKGINGPVDVRLDSSVSGTAGKPLDLDKTSVTVGPFVASVNGTVATHAGGFRVDATWQTQPVPCSTLARAEATKMGPIVEAIQDIAHKTGAARVTGTANASGLFRYDTTRPTDVSMTWTTREACGLSLFGL